MSDETLDGQPGAVAEPEMKPATGQDPAVAAVDETGVPAEAPVEDAAPVAPKDLGLLKEVLEALVFVHRGILPPKTAREVLGEEFTAEEIAVAFEALRDEYGERGGALTLYEVAGGWQFGTRTDLAPWIKKLDFYEHHRHLSRPTMETLAIIAYKQPATRAEIEAIRGVNVERIVRNLLERKLVKILGHKDVPGKPMVLGTTREFLELFGLNSLADLPPLKDFVAPPPAEGSDEETPLPLFAEGAGEARGGPGKRDDPAAATAGATRQETEHGAEPETGDGEPDTPEAPDDGGGPAADADEAR
ncbi:MAG: SMC-Scp complex subunit ScpB [Candidatus Methylomirabilia bacterium]